jgi:hypothetical protein
MTTKVEPVIPTPALLLAWLGVAPFLALAAVSWDGRLQHEGPAQTALVAYGAVILSFMGGVDWGLAMGRPARPGLGDLRPYGVSILPALLAWLSLALPSRAALGGLTVALGLLLAYDLWTARRGEAPAWYPRLRAPLTISAMACLALAGLH